MSIQQQSDGHPSQQADDALRDAPDRREPYVSPSLTFYDDITKRTGDEKGFWFGTQDDGS